MTKPIVFVALLAVLLANSGCKDRSGDKTLVKNNMKVTEETLKEIADAFNRHDLDAIMEYFSEDCSFAFPRGPEPWGQRFTGKAKVREGLASRFKGIPDVHYGEDRHWISSDGNRGVSEWTLTGTTTTGVRLKVN